MDQVPDASLCVSGVLSWNSAQCFQDFETGEEEVRFVWLYACLGSVYLDVEDRAGVGQPAHQPHL